MGANFAKRPEYKRSSTQSGNFSTASLSAQLVTDPGSAPARTPPLPVRPRSLSDGRRSDHPKALSAAAPSPEYDEPCIVARTFGLRSASLRIVGPVVGPRLVYRNKSSVPIEGPTMSPSVIGAPFPTCVKRSPHNNVPVVSSNMTPASHPCGTCGVSMYRRRLPPMSITSPLDNMRGGRSAISLIESRQPTIHALARLSEPLPAIHSLIRIRPPRNVRKQASATVALA